MATHRLQVKHRKGQDRLAVEPGSTLGALVTLLEEKSGIAASRLKIKVGFPPKPLQGGDAGALVSEVFPNGECLILEESDEPSVAPGVAGEALAPTPAFVVASTGAATSAPASWQAADAVPAAASSAAAAPAASAALKRPAGRPAGPTAPPQMMSSGVAVRRVVNADNSCLFTSLGYLLLGKNREAGRTLRASVADEILHDPETYNEAVLEKAPTVYATWIKQDNNWGGAIELAVLSDYFSAVIVAWDIKTGRADRYGDGKGFNQCVHLIYDGLHYDALAVSILEDVPPESEDFDVTVFSPADSYVDAQAKALIAKMQSAKLYTDTTSFTLRCLVCQKGLTGEADAVQHAKATGHQNFAEYK